MESYGQLHESDAMELATMICSVGGNARTKAQRVRMTLYCFSRLFMSADTPYFNVGRKTIAKACGVTDREAQLFLEWAEGTGWVVRIDGPKKGRVKRTFAWMCDETCTPERSPDVRQNVHPSDKSPANYVHLGERPAMKKRSPSETESTRAADVSAASWEATDTAAVDRMLNGEIELLRL